MQWGERCAFCGRDFWEAAQFVSSGSVAICDQCVEAAKHAMDQADPVGSRRIPMPPRVFGNVPAEDAVEQIMLAFQRAFIGMPGDEPSNYQEAADELEPYRQAAADQTSIRPVEVRLDRIRFINSDVADVRFQLLLNVGVAGPLDGRSVRRSNRWLVSRDTAVRLLAMGGIQVPPSAS